MTCVGVKSAHASHEVPANVLHEVRDWSGWVRRAAVDGRIAAAERAKLRAQGIIVEHPDEAADSRKGRAW